MRLRHHERFDYSPVVAGGVPAWPQGRGLAVYIALNLEHFAFGEGLGAALVPAAAGEPDVLNWSWREYGNRVGVWRLLELFDELELPCSVLVNSTIYDHCPQVMDAFRARGDEIVGHGRTNSERQGRLAEAEERALIVETTRRIAEAEGRPPRGWLGPWISESDITPDLLAEAGYRYCLDWCMDDRPVWMRTRDGGRILSVPYPQEINDIPALVVRQNGAADFADMIVDQFEEMRRQAERGPLVMGIALHPYLVGQPFRLRHVRRALQHVAAAKRDVWLTHAGAVADHIIRAG